MSYKIITKYIRDLSFEIIDSKTYFLIEKDIKNYRFICDINSIKIKENVLQVNVNLRLEPKEKNFKKNIHVSVELASIVQIEGKFPVDELEKIILIKVPTEIYPEIRNIIVFLFEKSGYKEIKIDETVDFRKLYLQRAVQ